MMHAVRGFGKSSVKGRRRRRGTFAFDRQDAVPLIALKSLRRGDL